MDDIKVATHKGRDIFYNEDGADPSFFVKGKGGGALFDSFTLSEVIEKLDKKAGQVERAEFERVRVFKVDYNGETERGEVTSTDGEYAWVAWDEGKGVRRKARSKESLDDLVIDNAEGKALLAKVQELAKSIAKMEGEKEKLERAFPTMANLMSAAARGR